MHRFPNPGSNLSNIINCFLYIYEHIDRNEVFGLHDMQELLVLNGLISSSGNVGVEALLGGSNKDLSRDKTYNQCKMYAEIYRSLGLMQSGDKALIYNFTLLGDHLARANVDRNPIITKCFIGMVFPNEVLASKGDYQLRPFAAILKTMRRLNGVITRDEMIMGPLSLDDDTNHDEFDKMCDDLLFFRANPIAFKEAMTSMLDKRGISSVTAQNYTRLPIAVLRDLNWASTKKDKTNYSKIQNTFELTLLGQQIVDDEINDHLDIRMHNLQSMDSDMVSRVSIFSFYKVLEFSGFDTSDLDFDFNELTNQIYDEHKTCKILFSPFQQLEREALFRIFQDLKPTSRRKSAFIPSDNIDQKNTDKLKKSIIPSNTNLDNEVNDFSNKVNTLLLSNSKEKTASIIKDEARMFTKENFYPLIGNIFNSMGIQCEIPPHGQNSKRWDAILLSEDDSIPIEIKSPTEEINISVKAVRQALENKIILQSRKAEKNQWGTSTYVVGFELPNLRAEVSELIMDIKKIYNINITILGIDDLLRLSIDCIESNKTVLFSDLTEIIGIIDG